MGCHSVGGIALHVFFLFCCMICYGWKRASVEVGCAGVLWSGANEWLSFAVVACVAQRFFGRRLDTVCQNASLPGVRVADLQGMCRGCLWLGTHGAVSCI